MSGSSQAHDGLTDEEATVIAGVLRQRGYQVEPAADSEAQSLTTRQVQVIRALWGRRSRRGAAETLGTSEANVKRHQEEICKRIGVHGRTALFQWALQHGLIHAPDAIPGGE